MIVGNMKKRIAVDLDGVLVDIIPPLCLLYNDTYGNSQGFVPKTKKDVDNWDFWIDWRLTEEAFYYLVGQVWENFESLPLVDYLCLKYLRKLANRAVVDIVTAERKNAEEKVKKFLERRNLIQGIFYHNLHIDKTKKLEMNYDIYVDDNPYLAKDIKDYPNKFLILFDQPWNQEIKNSSNVYRVKNWREIWKNLIKIL
jgi:5'(3')-deoxyribonucleotidase